MEATRLRDSEIQVKNGDGLDQHGPDGDEEKRTMQDLLLR